MKKSNLFAIVVPVLTLAGMPSAHAAGLCDYWPFSLTRLCQAHNGGGGTVNVPEPVVLALLAVGLVALGVIAYLRRGRRGAQ